MCRMGGQCPERQGFRIWRGRTKKECRGPGVRRPASLSQNREGRKARILGAARDLTGFEECQSTDIQVPGLWARQFTWTLDRELGQVITTGLGAQGAERAGPSKVLWLSARQRCCD